MNELMKPNEIFCEIAAFVSSHRPALLCGVLDPSRVGEDPGGRHRRGLRLRRAVCGAPPNFLLLPSARFGTGSILFLQPAAAAPAPAEAGTSCSSFFSVHSPSVRLQ